jgi:hypothetical protein
MDISDLTNELRFAETAREDEVRQKAKELGLAEQHVRVVLEQIAPHRDQQDHRHRHAHTREGNTASLFKPSHRSPLRRVLSSNVLASWLSRSVPSAIVVSQPRSLSRSLVCGLGQQEVLDSRQNVHDVAFAIDQLN